MLFAASFPKESLPAEIRQGHVTAEMVGVRPRYSQFVRLFRLLMDEMRLLCVNCEFLLHQTRIHV